MQFLLNEFSFIGLSKLRKQAMEREMVREEGREKEQEEQIRGCIRKQDADPTKA